MMSTIVSHELNVSNVKDIVKIGLTLILSVANVYLAIYTYRVLDEARKARKPYISIHLDHAETDPSLLFVIVQNIGQGIAYNLTFNIKQDILGDYGGEGRLINLKESVYLKKMEEELIINVLYYDSFRKHTKETFNIRLKEQSRVSILTPSDKYIGRIAESLNEIKRTLQNKS